MTAAVATAIELTASPVPSASTNADCAAPTTAGGASARPAPEPRPSTSASRAGPGTFGSDCSRSWRPITATSAPSAATPNVPPTMRNMERVPGRDARLGAVDRVHRRHAHRRHHEAHAEAHEDEGADEEAVARADLDARLPGERDRGDQEPGDHQRTRADAVGEPPGDRPGGDDHDGGGEEEDTGLERAVAGDVLHVEGQEEEHREHPERDHEGDDVRAQELLGAQRVEVDDRRLGAPLDRHERDQGGEAEPEQARGSRASPSPRSCPRRARTPARSG